MIRLGEDRADDHRDGFAVTLGDTDEQVSREVDPALLPTGSTQHAPDRQCGNDVTAKGGVPLEHRRLRTSGDADWYQSATTMPFMCSRLDIGDRLAWYRGGNEKGLGEMPRPGPTNSPDNPPQNLTSRPTLKNRAART